MTTTLDDRITAFLENRLGTAAQESARAEAADAEAERLREQVAAIAQWAGASDETELMSWVDSGQDGG